MMMQMKDTQWEYAGSWKHTFVSTRYPNFVPAGKRTMKAPGLYSDLLYQPWLCATVDIDETWLDVENIDRQSNLTVEEFKTKYEIPNKPVIITDIVKKWPAFEKWSRQSLRQSFSGKRVIVGDAPMNFESYIHYCDTQHDEAPLYLFDKEFCDKAPDLAGDFVVPDYFSQDLFSVLGKEERPDYRWLIYGPYKSGSTFHKDPNATCAWNAVIFGSKKWIMYPPHVTPPGVRTSEDGADVASPVSLMEWMLSFYDMRGCEGTMPLECILREGELLFVPRGWWHMAINLEECCAITQNYVSTANLTHVMKFLSSPHANKLVSGVETDEEKLSLHDRFLAALERSQPDVVADFNKRKREEFQVCS